MGAVDERGNQRRFARFGLVLLCVTGLIVPQGVSAAAPAGVSWDGVVTREKTTPILLDPTGRRLYTMTGADLSEFDLDAPYGKMLLRRRTLPLKAAGHLSDNAVTADFVNHRAFIADRDIGLGDGSPCHACSFVQELDLRTLRFTRQWDLYERFPNFMVHGLTYSPEDKNLYLMGVTTGGTASYTADWGSVPFQPVTVIALDSETGNLLWIRQLTQCLLPMVTFAVGGHIFRSRDSDALYLGCARADAPSNTAPYPGTAGVLRLNIQPNADQLAALAFPQEFFRAPGTYFAASGPNARMTFDYATDRLAFVTNSATTPGLWVFDGQMSSWMGFVPTTGSGNRGIAFDAVSGHVFLRDGTASGLLVTDMRGSPVPQGDAFDLASPRQDLSAVELKPYLADPITRRVFIPAFPVNEMGVAVPADEKLIAFRDETPISKSQHPVGYDDLTSGLSESASTTTTFAGSSRSFGARAFLVGGTGAPTSPARSGSLHKILASKVGDVVPPADRGAWLARTKLDLRNVGATADARAAVTDDGTDDQRRTAQQQTAATSAPLSVALERNAGTKVSPSDALEWPWPDAFCIDPDDTPSTVSPVSPGGAAMAHCDRKDESASARASVGASNGNGISIGSTRVVSTAERRFGKGVRMESDASVYGVEITMPGSGTVRIGYMGQHVVTEAGGTSGTAKVEWRPTVQAVHLTDGTGKDIYACGNRCDLRTVASHVNSAFAQFLRMRVPVPERTSTPGGAFATFREGMSEYVNDLVMNNDASRAVPTIEFELYNDAADKSRLLLQIAAIESSAIYGIWPDRTAEGSIIEPRTVGIPSVSTSPGPNEFGGLPPDGKESITADHSRSFGGRVVEAVLFLTRSPGDFFSVLLLWLLLGCGVMLCARRSSLAKAWLFDRVE
jgi:hypothetical protein